MTFLVQQTLIYAVPLMIVALAGVFAERSGIINLALEGIMIFGAFIGVLFVRSMQSFDVFTQAAKSGDWLTLQGLELLAMLASAAMSLSSVCVVSNALRLRGWKPKLPAANTLPPVTEVECTLLPQQAAPTAESQETAAPAAGQSLTLHIEGMMCNHCVGRVKSALEALPGVTAEVNLAKNTATLTMAEPHSVEELTAAVEAAGYKVTNAE